MSRRRFNLQVPIALASVAVALSVALLVAWVLVVAHNMHLTRQVAENVWLLVAGILSLVLIIGVLVVFSVIVVRETIELRRQTSFIDSVTHELKSPLASLRLCVDTMERSGLGEQQLATLRAMMRKDLDRLTVFIDDVLDASRLAHGKRPHVMAEVALGPMLDVCVQRVCDRHGVSREAITVSVPHGLKFTTDATALETVLTNLLDNAVKYSDPPVRVEVEAEAQGGLVALTVRDHGIGLAPKECARVFERFYRVDSEAVRTRRGTGLGLFVVQALVRSLGGRVEASSPGEGSGTSFVVTLPTEEAHANDA